MVKKKLALTSIFAIMMALHVCGQASTVYFYRAKNMLMSNTVAGIVVNDTIRFSLVNGAYHAVTTEADLLKITTSPNNTGIQSLKLDKGKTYYVEVQMKVNSIEVVHATEYTGKAAVERLQTEEQIKQAHPEDLGQTKVNAVEPLPQAQEDVATIYLFRPFNVLGVSLVVKVAAGDSLFLMKNNSAHVLRMQPGEINLRTLNEQKTLSDASLKLKAEKGKVYYVAVLRSGGALLLTETKEGYAKSEMKLK